MNELLLAGWVLGSVELSPEFVEQLAEQVRMDNDGADTETPYFIRIISVADFDQKDEIRELAYIALHHDFDEQIINFSARGIK